MPKAAKAKRNTRANPLQRTDGNVIKKEGATSKSRSDVAVKKEESPVAETKVAIEDEQSPATETKVAVKNEESSAATATTASRLEGTGTPSAIDSDKPTRRPQGRENLGPNYLFLCHLSGTEDPTITRFLTVPPDLTFNGMHEVMQAAFGWAGYHHWWFKVGELLSMEERRTRRPKNLIYLSRPMTLNMSMDEGHQNAGEWILADVFDNERYAGKVEVIYEYDMGDSWEHDIALIGREAPGMREAMMIPEDAYIACLGGEGHPCAEDSGSYEGWEYLKEVFAKARVRDPEERELKDWYKTECPNGDPKGLNPYKWDVIEVNQALDEINALRTTRAGAQSSA